jgi:hypothetical protein
VRTPALALTALLLLAPAALRAAGHPCGAHDLTFGCTDTEEQGRPRVGCGVHEGSHFFSSEWRVYDLQTEKVLVQVASNPDGIALVDLPTRRWLVVEGEIVCDQNGGDFAIPYRFLVERTGKDGLRQRTYTPETLEATGNWNVDTQLQYGAFRSRSLLGTGAGTGAATGSR